MTVAVPRKLLELHWKYKHPATKGEVILNDLPDVGFCHLRDLIIELQDLYAATRIDTSELIRMFVRAKQENGNFMPREVAARYMADLAMDYVDQAKKKLTVQV